MAVLSAVWSLMSVPTRAAIASIAAFISMSVLCGGNTITSAQRGDRNFRTGLSRKSARSCNPAIRLLRSSALLYVM